MSKSNIALGILFVLLAFLANAAGTDSFENSSEIVNIGNETGLLIYNATETSTEEPADSISIDDSNNTAAVQEENVVQPLPDNMQDNTKSFEDSADGQIDISSSDSNAASTAIPIANEENQQALESQETGSNNEQLSQAAAESKSRTATASFGVYLQIVD